MADIDAGVPAAPEDMRARCRALFVDRHGDTLVLYVRHAHRRGQRDRVVGVLETVGRFGGAWRTPRGYRLYFAWVDWWDGTVVTDDAAVTRGLSILHRDVVEAVG